MNKTQEMETTELLVENKETLKKSALISEQKELFEINETLLKEMQEREYSIDLKSKKIFDNLLKFLEKDAPWGHTTATGLIMLYHNLREQKEFVKLQDWAGFINLRSANITILWSMVTKMTGKGFYEAKAFVELMAVCGESLSKAVQQAHNDNNSLRQNHHRLSILDDQLASGDFIDDMESTDVVASLANEVDPIVEL
jgi:hypothetical protein